MKPYSGADLAHVTRLAFMLADEVVQEAGKAYTDVQRAQIIGPIAAALIPRLIIHRLSERPDATDEEPIGTRSEAFVKAMREIDEAERDIKAKRGSIDSNLDRMQIDAVRMGLRTLLSDIDVFSNLRSMTIGEVDHNLQRFAETITYMRNGLSK